MSHHPPRWLIAIFRWFCHPKLHSAIEGDLFELYDERIRELGKRKADILFALDVLRLFRPGIIRPLSGSQQLNHFGMIRNYMTTALRVSVRNKGYSFINILGLTLGMTGAILLSLWIEYEFSYDQFHENKVSLYSAWNRSNNNGHISCWDVTPRILASTLEQEYAGIEHAVSYSAWGSNQVLKIGDEKFFSNQSAFTDEAFFKIFTFPFLKGSSDHAFDIPNSIVLTESFAKELFGSREPMGETITLEESGQSFGFTVTGILKDLPRNTQFKFQYVISFKFLKSLGWGDPHWGNNSLWTFVKLKPGFTVDQVNANIKDIIRTHSKETERDIFLYPFASRHLYGKFVNGVQSGGRIETMRMMMGIALLLIVVSCINFINLSTARAQKRAKEVGVRKVTGARSGSLIFQFIFESTLVAAAAGLVSMALVYLILPWFNVLIGQQIVLHFSQARYWVALLALIVLVGLAAGSYPAFVLSSFNPARVLKGGQTTLFSRSLLRQSLVVFQFGFAVVMIFSVVIVVRQINYTQNRAVGYTRDNLLFHSFSGDLPKNIESYRKELLASGLVESVTVTSSPITDRMSNTDGIEWNGKNPTEKVLFERFVTDQQPVKTLGLQLIEGRDLDLEAHPTDSSAMILNETAAKAMGFANPIGEKVRDSPFTYEVVGVVKDFVLTSPMRSIEPILIMGGKLQMFGTIHLRLSNNLPIQETLEKLHAIHSKHNPNFPFDYQFADDSYDQKFRELRVTLQISSIFGGLTVIIACLGLLGLSTYMIENRVKEIGIRKALGSSVTGIVRLLGVDSLIPIVIAIVIFSPVGYFAITKWWLETYEYRITPGIVEIGLSAMLILFIAIVTIGSQTWSAARANPIKGLRSE